MGGAASLRLFRLRNFRALWIGQLFSIFGDRFTYLALLALVIERARDPGNPAPELALIPLASFLPAILFGPWIGALVDGWNTRTTLLISDAVRALIVLAIIPAVGWGGLPAALALVFLLYVVNAFFLPARSAILPDLVPQDALVEANSLATLAGILATVAGSILGGVIIERAGWRIGFALDAVTYLISVAALAFIRVVPRSRPARSGKVREVPREIARDVREGGRIALGSPAVLGSIGAMALLWIAGGALHVSLPQRIGQAGGGMISGMGGALGSAALGMVAGTLVLAGAGRAMRARTRVVLSLAGGGLALIAFAVLSHPAALTGSAFVAGFFVSFLLVTTESVIQASVGAEARGRVFALRDFLARAGVLLSAGAVGALLARAWLSPTGAVGAAGAILVVGSMVGTAAGLIRNGRGGSKARAT